MARPNIPPPRSTATGQTSFLYGAWAYAQKYNAAVTAEKRKAAARRCTMALYHRRHPDARYYGRGSGAAAAEEPWIEES